MSLYLTMTDKTTHIGWDVGGAHIKAVCVAHDGALEWVAQEACPLWEGMDRLDGVLGAIADARDLSASRHAVTMTGELTDAFVDRNTGVAEIVAAMARRLQQDFAIYAGAAGFVKRTVVAQYAPDIASANWYATASFAAGRLAEGVVVDIGSTTCDLIPFQSGRVKTSALTDADRLLAGELVYTGVVRTPVMALGDRFNVDGREQAVMAEMFATAADVYRVLKQLPPHADMYPTCDGADKDEHASARRLARMFGHDYAGEFDLYRRAAAAIADAQQQKIAEGLEKVSASSMIGSDAPLVGAGVGSFVVKAIAKKLARPFIRFDELLPAHTGTDSAQLAECATAFSLAQLARAQGCVQ